MNLLLTWGGQKLSIVPIATEHNITWHTNIQTNTNWPGRGTLIFQPITMYETFWPDIIYISVEARLNVTITRPSFMLFRFYGADNRVYDLGKMVFDYTSSFVRKYNTTLFLTNREDNIYTNLETAIYHNGIEVILKNKVISGVDYYTEMTDTTISGTSITSISYGYFNL